MHTRCRTWCTTPVCGLAPRRAGRAEVRAAARGDLERSVGEWHRHAVDGRGRAALEGHDASAAKSGASEADHSGHSGPNAGQPAWRECFVPSLRGCTFWSSTTKRTSESTCCRCWSSAARVSACGSASEAFLLLTQERPDLLLSDLAMPEEDGYQRYGGCGRSMTMTEDALRRSR